MVVYYVIVAVLGLIIGSFLNVCIYRIPEEKSIIKPPSHCTGCGTRLGFMDLIPVLSYLLIKGRCRYCRIKIPARYPAVELLTAAAFVMLFARYGFSADFAAFVYLVSILIIVFFIDLKHRIIPDELVIAGTAGALIATVYNIFHPLHIYGDTNWWNPIVGMLTGSGFLFLVAVIGLLIYKTDDAMGMGDVKIFIPIGIFLGWRMTALTLVISLLLGGLAGVVFIITGLKKRRDTIPFGPFIVAGAFITMLWGWDILNIYLTLYR